MPTEHKPLRDQVAVLREQSKWHDEWVNREGKWVVSGCTDSLKKTSHKLKALNSGSRRREETMGVL